MSSQFSPEGVLFRLLSVVEGHAVSCVQPVEEEVAQGSV